MSQSARAWSETSVGREGADHVVLLDGQPLRLPGGDVLRLRNAALAEAIRAEWQQAGSAPRAEAIPLTALAGTAQLRVAPAPEATADALAAYAADDLLCYRAPATQPLAGEQAREWDSWLAWAASAIPARLATTQGVVPLHQDRDALAACRAALTPLLPETLAGLGVVIPALGSFVLGLALERGALDAPEAAQLATLEERAQLARWGADAELTARIERWHEEVASATRFLRLASGR